MLLIFARSRYCEWEVLHGRRTAVWRCAVRRSGLRTTLTRRCRRAPSTVSSSVHCHYSHQQQTRHWPPAHTCRHLRPSSCCTDPSASPRRLDLTPGTVHQLFSQWECLKPRVGPSIVYNNNNNNHDNVYGAVIMAEPLREFTRFIWWM